MLGFATGYPFAPETKWARLNLLAHKINDCRLIEAKVELYGLEGRSILPGHLDNA